jgi:hypothetical protein
MLHAVFGGHLPVLLGLLVVLERSAERHFERCTLRAKVGGTALMAAGCRARRPPACDRLLERGARCGKCKGAAHRKETLFKKNLTLTPTHQKDQRKITRRKHPRPTRRCRAYVPPGAATCGGPKIAL